MTRDIPDWRSLLYIPANNDRYIQAAHKCDADAIILDLEDSIAEHDKISARSCLPDAICKLKEYKFDIVVRVNSDVNMADDIWAAVAAGAFAIDLPKVTNAAFVADACKTIMCAEEATGRPIGSVKLKLLLESAEAFLKILEISSFVKDTPRIVGITAGNEDLATQLSLRDKTGPMLHFYHQLVVAAAYCEILPLGMPGDLTDYLNLDELSVQARVAKDMGLMGSSCIHPSQVKIINQVFGPSAEEVSDARALLRLADEKSAQGIGVFKHNGRMVDEPVVERARRLLKLAERIRTRPSVSAEGAT